MSGYATEERPGNPPKDPLLRLLGGCVVVVGIVLAIVVAGALLIGWRLGRDDAPGRAPETFLVGDESRYWCLDLKPDDTGLAVLFARFNEINDETRRSLVRGTFLEALPLPQRRARLDELAPFKLEFALATADPADGLQAPKGWAARGTFSHGLFRLRAAMKLMRFLARRDPEKTEMNVVDGVAVTEVRGASASFAFANVGNRILVTSDSARMRTALGPLEGPAAPRLSPLLDLHDEIAIDGEDAWAFLATTRIGDMANPFSTNGAAASFDINDRDELVFRIAVKDPEPVLEGRGFSGSRADRLALVSRFLPGLPAEAIVFAEDGAKRGDHGHPEFSGHVAELSKRLAALLGDAKGLRMMRRGGSPLGRETPSATPTPETPQPPSGPRSDTPGGPKHEGTPTPPR